MKTRNIYYALILMVAATSAMISPRNGYAADAAADKTPIPALTPHGNSKVRVVELEIDADRDKIIEETSAIRDDRRRLKGADKMSDKTGAAHIAEEISKDIVARDARIGYLKKEIKDKKAERYILMNGKHKDEPRRTRLDAK